ncbi:EpsI family protein [Sphingomonas xinjiangensis]|uniref:EpsI family protein n=2 Tax=Sphingomonas xinjiangensis TaxID=643568 RepID=A0A840YFF1_9SPHN|nr:EpsI family protein [Sphingomonas xinjiangensis]
MVPGSIENLFPTRFESWRAGADSGFVLPPEDERKAAAVYDDQIALTYSNGNDTQIMLLIAYAREQSGMLMIHRPESCYPGAGFSITADRPASISLEAGKSVPGRFISAEKLPRIEQVLYWSRLGDEFVSSWDEERESLAKQNLRGFIPDGALIRVSLVSADEGRALETLREFVSALYRSTSPQGRSLLAGRLSYV